MENQGSLRRTGSRCSTGLFLGSCVPADVTVEHRLLTIQILDTIKLEPGRKRCGRDWDEAQLGAR